jgi:hypothetical protein
MISNDMKISFTQDAMQNLDDFLQFGYSFLNGLLNDYNKEENNKVEAKNE